MRQCYHFPIKSKYAIREAAVTSFEVNGNFTADDSAAVGVALPVVINICGNCDNHGKPPYFCKNMEVYLDCLRSSKYVSAKKINRTNLGILKLRTV